MALSVTHATLATGTDAGNGEIHKAQWNEAHTVSGTLAAASVTGLAAVATSGSASDLSTGTLPSGRVDVTAAYVFTGLGKTKILAGAANIALQVGLPDANTTFSNGWQAADFYNANATTGNWAQATFSDNTGAVTSGGFAFKFTDRTNHYGDFYLYNVQSDGYVLRFGLVGTDVLVNTSAKFGFASAVAGTGFSAIDAYWGRLGAASIVQGGAAAASPVAQTYSAQSSRAGTDTDVGGANLTVAAGTGTGTGALSSLVLKSPVAVASGTGAQTLTTGLTIKGGQAVASTYTVSTLPTGIAGGMAYVTDGDAGLAWGATVINSGAGATKYLVWFNNANWTVMGK